MLSPITLLAWCALQGATEAPVPLFDGASLAGWSGDAKFWTVEDGVIVGRSTEQNPCRRTTWLVCEAGRYENFELSLEVQLEGGNSGVQFRSRLARPDDVHGPQADLDQSGEWTGGLYEQGGRGVLVRRGTALAIDDAGATRATAVGDAAELLTAATARDWDRLTVRCEGRTTTIRWNDVLTSRLDDGGPSAWRSEGLIALQLHAGPPMTVRFRNVSVTPLEAAVEVEPAFPELAGPEWIWDLDTPEGDSAAVLTRRITPRAPVRRAVVWGACDNGVELFAGERRIAVSDDWSRPFERDVTAELPTGPFDLVARCWNEGGPAGLVLRLTLQYEDGTDEVVVTDRAWRTEDGGEVASFGAFGVGPWGTPATVANGTARGVLDPAELVLPAGFSAELVYEVPRRQGSWVALTIDDRGRIYAADERGRGLYRLTERADGPPLVEELPLGFGAAQGLCTVRRSDGALDLFVMLHPYGSDKVCGVWRARDVEDDGTFDRVELILPLPGATGEHGAHAIVAAPDGSGLYVMAGNHVPLADEIAVHHAPPLWQEDQLLPPLPDPNGHAVGVPVPGGWFLKMDFDGGQRELVSIGMRNAYDFAFDRAGHALTYDSDMEWDMGAPWYRAPRILQLAPGADFGWRNGSGKVPDWAEDTLGTVVDTGPASPTGVLHTKDLAFHAPWDDVLLAADWAYGTVHAVHTRPVADGGLTLTGELQPFIQGKPFPVTDLAAHPDGSLLVAIGGRGTRSAIYRVRSLAGVERRAPQQVPDPLAVYRDARDVPFTDRAWRSYRRALFENALRTGSDPADALVTLAGGPPSAAFLDDPMVARATRVAAVRAGASLGLSPTLLDGFASAAVEQLTQGAVEDALATLRAIEIGLARATGDVQLGAQQLAALCAQFPSGDTRIDRALAALLVRSQYGPFTPGAVAALAQASTQEEALYLLYVLRLQTAGWTPELREDYLEFLYVDAARFHGGHSLQRYVERIRSEANQRLGEGWTPPPAPEAAPSPPIAARIFVKEWAVADLAPRGKELEDRDLARGRHVFEAARCAECHRFDGTGGSTGPDLTGAGARYSAEDLLLAILEPSRDLTDQYQDTEVWTTDGVVHLGRIIEEDGEWVTLMPPPPNEAERIDVPRAEIKLRRPHPTSRMPKSLLDGFRREDALDLIAYLLGPRSR